MARRRTATSAEVKLWRTVMRDVKPLGTSPGPIAEPKGASAPAPVSGVGVSGEVSGAVSGKVRDSARPTKSKALKKAAAAANTAPATVSRSMLEEMKAMMGVAAPSARKAAENKAGEKPISLRVDAPTTPGVDLRTDLRLKRGRYPIDARLDLHGLDRVSAREQFAGFIECAYSDGRRCILVITGKGSFGRDSGILRRSLPQWVNEPGIRERVLSIRQAQSMHGGGGAFYVLLHSSRKDGRSGGHGHGSSGRK